MIDTAYSRKRRSKSLRCQASSQPHVFSITSRIVRQWSAYRNSRSSSEAGRRLNCTDVSLTLIRPIDPGDRHAGRLSAPRDHIARLFSDTLYVHIRIVGVAIVTEDQPS